MHPRCCDHYYENTPKKNYRLVIMDENGKTSFHGWFCGFDEVRKAVEEIRGLYEKHGINHHVGYVEA